MKNKKFVFSMISIVLLVIVDQISKKLVVKLLAEKSIDIIPDILSFTLLEGGNTGAAFGLLKGGFWFFMFATFIIIYFALLFLRRIPNGRRYQLFQISLILLLAGAFGNLVDRISTMVQTGSSYVVDFIYFELIDFPIFNIADCYISISAFLLIVLGGFYYKDSDYELILGKKEKNDARN